MQSRIGDRISPSIDTTATIRRSPRATACKITGSWLVSGQLPPASGGHLGKPLRIARPARPPTSRRGVLQGRLTRFRGDLSAIGDCGKSSRRLRWGTRRQWVGPSGRSSAWLDACFGSRRSHVRIVSPRLRVARFIHGFRIDVDRNRGARSAPPTALLMPASDLGRMGTSWRYPLGHAPACVSVVAGSSIAPVPPSHRFLRRTGSSVAPVPPSHRFLRRTGSSVARFPLSHGFLCRTASSIAWLPPSRR